MNNVTFVHDDVRNLNAKSHGHFDVVLSLGILYHLDAPDVFEFVEKIAEVCRRVAIIDTHVTLWPNKSHTFKGHPYHGWSYVEHSSAASTEARMKVLWASLENQNSFWFTRPSLHNLLSRVGFTSVYTCQQPAVRQALDRDTIVAVKGVREDILSMPTSKDVPDEISAEQSPFRTFRDLVLRRVGNLATKLRR